MHAWKVYSPLCDVSLKLHYVALSEYCCLRQILFDSTYIFSGASEALLHCFCCELWRCQQIHWLIDWLIDCRVNNGICLFLIRTYSPSAKARCWFGCPVSDGVIQSLVLAATVQEVFKSVNRRLSRHCSRSLTSTLPIWGQTIYRLVSKLESVSC